jgi:large subunit ribosomal protein L4
MPRSYEAKVNVKAKKAALKSVLSERLAEGRLFVLDSLELDTHRTKDFQGRVDRLGLAGDKVLFVDSYDNLNLMLATRNRPELAAADALHMHVYEAMRADRLVFSRRGLTSLVEVLAS